MKIGLTHLDAPNSWHFFLKPSTFQTCCDQAVTRNENKKKLNGILCTCISLRGDLYPLFLFEF